MKYCNNCKTLRKSWAENLNDYKKYSDNQCWECDKYTLTSSNLAVVPAGSKDSFISKDAVNTAVGEVRRGERKQFTFAEEGINENTGEYRAEQVQYKNGWYTRGYISKK